MPGPRDYRAVLIDMDDTLFDHSLTCRDAIGRLRTAEPFLRRRPLDDLWHDYLRLLNSGPSSTGIRAGGVTIDEARVERWRQLARSCGADLVDGESRRISQLYRRNYQKLRRAVPGARDLLSRLHRRVKVVVVTNNEVAEQQEKLAFLGFGSLVDGMVVSEAVGVAKPDPRIFEAALSTAGVEAEEATMLGDSWAHDIVGAHGVGVRPVWFNRFALPRPDDLPVAEVRSLRPAAPTEEVLIGGPRTPERIRRRGPSTAL